LYFFIYISFAGFALESLIYETSAYISWMYNFP